jgi:hypothetical protein
MLLAKIVEFGNELLEVAENQEAPIFGPFWTREGQGVADIAT